MKVSFLVTYYNQKEYVKQSIESILAIDKPCEWEIIIGDDGSTDGTIEIIKEYIKKYPKEIKMYIMPRIDGKKYNSVKRASANRLNILEHSTGDIFCTLDGDDYYCDTSFVKEAIEVFKKHKNVSIVAFGFKYVTNGISGKEFTLPQTLINRYVNKKIFLKNLYLHAGGCVHKKCFDEKRIKYIKSLGYFDDNNIVINSLNFGEMFALNKVIYSYRQTGKSVYTSMNKLEQAVLNVQGMDVDLRLISSIYQPSIIKRYSPYVILMYLWKEKIHAILGSDKYQEYKEGCYTLMPSICYEILNFSSISKRGKRIFFYKIMLLNIRCTIKEIIRYWIGGKKLYEK